MHSVYIFINACVLHAFCFWYPKAVVVATAKTFEEQLNELGIILSPLTTDNESDEESTKIAAKERGMLYGRVGLPCMTYLIVHLMPADAIQNSG